jgi:hypothetical protein
VHTLTSTPEINKSEEERKLQWNRTIQKNRTKKVEKKNLTEQEKKKEKEKLLKRVAVQINHVTKPDLCLELSNRCFHGDLGDSGLIWDFFGVLRGSGTVGLG